jgi:hypothetical protein
MVSTVAPDFLRIKPGPWFGLVHFPHTGRQYNSLILCPGSLYQVILTAEFFHGLPQMQRGVDPKVLQGDVGN